MKKYRTYLKDKLYIVKEIKTNSVIYISKQSTHCSKIVNNLNSGGGFDGESPSFFINKKDQKYA